MTPSHVIIRGHVFTYEEKSPFVASGKSILGALEYSQKSESVKCHECGIWIRGLGGHIKLHGLKRAEYNVKHGLRITSALSGMATRAKHRHESLRQDHAAFLASRSRRGKGPKSVEWMNENARCKAQLIFRIQVLAATIGHTPGHADLRAADISPATISSRFGRLSVAMDLADLAPNDPGHPPNPIPRQFPSSSEIETLWNQRMPWPEEYFTVNPFEKRRDAVPI